NIYCKAGQPISFSSSTSSSSNAPSSGSSSSTPPSTPEFGSISALVLTLAITSIILIRYKNNHKNHI
ncbi:MAG: PEFG-CTERM sorting domain-containing protein, partial [Thaumarchaeota archaeon]